MPIPIESTIDRLQKMLDSPAVQDGIAKAQPGTAVGIVVYTFEVEALLKIVRAAIVLSEETERTPPWPEDCISRETEIRLRDALASPLAFPIRAQEEAACPNSNS